jgi:hypothetical protein
MGTFQRFSITSLSKTHTLVSPDLLGNTD